MSRAALRSQMLPILQRLVADVLLLRTEGATYDRMGRAQGLVDGYMRAIIDAGIAEQHELLGLVKAQRLRECGPAVREMSRATEASDSVIAA